MSALLGGLLFALGVIAIVLALGYIITKMRSGEPLELSFRSFLLGYFYLMIVASILVTSIGAASLVQAGMGAALGNQFSYWAPPTPVFEPAPPPGAPRERLATPTEQQRAEQLDRQLREGILQGASLSLVGGLFLGLHWWGRRRLAGERQGTLDTALNKAHLMILLAIYSVVGLITLPWGIFELLRYYIVPPPQDQFTAITPGSTLSVAVVFVPLWIFFLISVLGELRKTDVVPAT